MKQKKERCKYCNEKMVAKTTRAEFCSKKCKVYWHRENPKVKLTNFKKKEQKVTASAEAGVISDMEKQFQELLNQKKNETSRR